MECAGTGGRQARAVVRHGRSSPAPSGSGESHLIQPLRLQADVGLAGSLLAPVLLNPRLPAPAGSGVLAGELEARDVAVADRNLLVTVPGDQSDEAVGQARAGAPTVEDVAVDRRTGPRGD